VIDDNAQNSPERQGLQREARPHERERADLADEVEARVTR
jgi:hypothetical protein